MKKLDPTMAQQVAQAISVFQEQRTGYPPKAVTVVLSDDTLVVTLHEALSPAEKALASTPEGAAQVQEFHRQLFKSSVDLLREEIKRITGVAVGEAAAEVETTTGAVVQHSRAARWCRCSGSPAESPRRPGTGMDQAISHKTRRVCHVSPVKEKPGIGRSRRVRWLSSPVESHGARD